MLPSQATFFSGMLFMAVIYTHAKKILIYSTFYTSVDAVIANTCVGAYTSQSPKIINY